MALVHCDPFAHYSSSHVARLYPDLIVVSGTITTGAFGRDGDPGLRFTSYEDAALRKSISGLSSGAVCIQQCDFRISSAPSIVNGVLGVFDGATTHVTLAVNTNRTLAIYLGDAVGTLLGTSTYAVPLNTYIHLGIKVTIADAPSGSVVVHVWEDADTAAQVVLNLTGIDTKNTANATWNGYGVGGGTSTGNTDYCNYVVMDGSGSTLNNFLGPVDVTALFASNRETPSLGQWTPSTGGDVVPVWDDAAPDDDTTYASSSTQDHQQTVAVDACPRYVPVLGASLYLCAKRASGTPQIRPIGYQDAMANLGASVALGASYTYVEQPYSAMPDGSALSTAEVFNELQWGAKLTTATDPARITQLVVAIIQGRFAEDDGSPDYDVQIGDETGLNPILETFRIQETVDAPDTMIADFESTGSPYQRFSVGQLVFVTENGVRIFGGHVTGVRERGFTPNCGDLVVEVQATSYELNAKRRVITTSVSAGSPSSSLVDVLNDLITDYYGDLGVTLHPDQSTGPDVPYLAFERQRGDSVNQQIAESVGYLQAIDFENRLRMWAPGDILAPFDYDEDVNPESLTGDIEVERQLQNGYANRVILVGEPIVIPDFSDPFTGDGIADTFGLTYLIGGPFPYSPDGAVGYGVVRYLDDNSTESLGGLLSPVGFFWEYDPIAQTVRRRGGAPVNARQFVILYHGLFIPEAEAEDAGEIATYGLWEHVEEVTAVTTDASAQEIADAILAKKLASKDEIITLRTRNLGYHPGQTINVSSPKYLLTGGFLITQVDTGSEAGSHILLKTITAAKSQNNNHDWRRVYRQWAGESAGTSGGGTTSTTSQAGAGTGPHGTNHQAGGIDPIKLDNLAAPDDNTDLDVSTSTHGLVPMIDGSDGYVLTNDGTSAVWAPSTGSGSPAPEEPGMVLIEEKTPSGTGTLTFSSLGAYTHLELRWQARGTDGASSVNMNMQFNGDTGANYDMQRTQSVATGITGVEVIAGTSASIATLVSAGGTADMASAGSVTIYDYAGTTFQKHGTAHDVVHRTTATANTFQQSFGFGWRNTAAVTSITIFLAAGNYVAGSKFTLYGLR